jgi:hypothetical protein
MKQQPDTKPISTIYSLTLALVGALIVGCSGEKKPSEQDCVDPPSADAGEKKTVKIERFGLGKAGDEDKEKKDWCRACVMSQVGYASCQRVFAETEGEDRDSLRKRARDKACVDAKYPAGACPEKAVINVQCKGDAPPAGTPDPGTALQNLYQKLGGGQPKAAPKPADKDDKPAANPQPPKKPVVE